MPRDALEAGARPKVASRRRGTGRHFLQLGIRGVQCVPSPDRQMLLRSLVHELSLLSKDSSLLEGTEYRVVDTEDGQVASVALTLDPDEEVLYKLH